jgi:hypothetical protein
MKKGAWVVMLLMLFVSSCKTTKTHCDAYGGAEYDIHKLQLESEKKYSTTCTIK